VLDEDVPLDPARKWLALLRAGHVRPVLPRRTDCRSTF
jgi:hypothetical protein